MSHTRVGGPALWILGSVLVLAGCASKGMVLDLRASVMYDKPAISEVDHSVDERRLDDGPLVVAVTMTGDPGLVATFDISPGIADRQPMREVEDGRYEGTFSFTPDLYGGPYWVTGRLVHERAGEHVMRDPVALTITVPDR